jgi:hypothetical protein
MGDGIDDAMGIKAKEPDYTMRNWKWKDIVWSVEKK